MSDLSFEAKIKKMLAANNVVGYSADPSAMRDLVVKEYAKHISENWTNGQLGAQLGEQFTATPVVEQILIKRMVELGGAFMQAHVMTAQVSQLVGERIIMSPSGLTSKRTNTVTTDRAPADILSLEDRQYTLKKVEDDISIPYSTIDSWQNQFGNFSAMWQEFVLTGIVNSIICTGWNGTSAETATNSGTYPLRQDLNIGWLQRLRAYDTGSKWTNGQSLSCTFTDAGDVVTSTAHGLVNGQIIQFSTITTTTGISEDTDYYVVGAATDTFQVSDTLGGAAKALTTNGTGVIYSPINVGTGKDYANLDTLISTYVSAIPDYLRNNLVAYVSDDLIAASRTSYYTQTSNRVREKVTMALNPIDVLETYGGLPCVVPPYMPAGTVLIAPRGSLHYYEQRNSRRRYIENYPKRDAYYDWNTVNSGYVLAQEEACQLIENIDIFSN
jgi:hypothetical protein